MLDLILTDSPGYIFDSGISEPIGDPNHCCIYCKVKINLKKPHAYTRLIWKYHVGDFLGLNDCLLNAPWAPMDIFLDINDASDYFRTLFLDTCKEFIPTKKVTIRPKDKPWINNALRKLFRERNRAYKKWKKHSSDTNLENYNQIKREVIAVKKDAKHNYFLRLSNKLTDPNTGPKEYWHLTKELFGNKIKSGIPPIIKNDIVFSSSESKCQLFNDHFLEKSKLPDQKPSLPQFTPLTNNTFEYMQVTENEVLKVLKNLNVAKANGPDGISNTHLKSTADSIASPLCKLFNRSLATGQFPDEWKEANVSPVFKKNDRQSVKNYRPISLLSNVGKVLERLVFIKLYEYCQANNLLTWRNSGYKPFDSTINQLVLLSHKIYEALENGHDVCFVSLDASAAFDRVWHEGLLFKLRQFGIKGTFYNWIKNYLNGRKQRVVIEGSFSEWIRILCGVPQGSILGPLLFLIYTNDIVEDIECEILLFADDTSLLEPLTDPTLSIAKINRDLHSLGRWAGQWLVTFNPAKTKYMIFSKKNVRQDYGHLFLENKKIEEVKEHKQLGITFNNKMTWDEHINDRCKEAGRRLSVIKRLPDVVSPITKRHIYTTFVRPVLEYGSVLFDNCSVLLSDQLESVQRQSAIAITRAYSNTSNVNLYKEVGLTLLKSRRTKAKLILFHKIKFGNAPEYLKQLLPQVRMFNTISETPKIFEYLE